MNNKSINEIATQLGIFLVGEPLVDTLSEKSNARDVTIECFAIIYFARLTSIKYVFPPFDRCATTDDKLSWLNLSKILDDICFKCIERYPMQKEFDLALLASPCEYETARREFFVHDLNEMRMNIPTFYRGICAARHNRYIRALDEGFKINRKHGELSIDCWHPLAAQVVNDLSALSLRCEPNEVIGSIAVSPGKACAFFTDNGLYKSICNT